MTKYRTQDHTAVDSAAGYYYQGMFALLTLLEEGSDEAQVTVETFDDVVLKDGEKLSLYQLKHSLKANPTGISVKSDKIWKTMKSWIDTLSDDSFDATELILVSVAPIQTGSLLEPLVAGTTPTKDDIFALCESLEAEAERVIEKRSEEQKEGKHDKELSYQVKYLGCRSFLNLDREKRIKLLETVKFQPKASNAAELPVKLEQVFRYIKAEVREQLVEKLLEWWDRQVVLALIGKRPSSLYMSEVQSEAASLIAKLNSDELSTTFYDAEAPVDCIADACIIKQLELVKASARYMRYLTLQEWQARNQRFEWLDDDFSMFEKISRYDKYLIAEWDRRHDKVRNRCKEGSDELSCMEGQKLLEWSSDEAPNQLNPVQGGWMYKNFVTGNYQYLSGNLDVGWHPEYRGHPELQEFAERARK